MSKVLTTIDFYGFHLRTDFCDCNDQLSLLTYFTAVDLLQSHYGQVGSVNNKASMGSQQQPRSDEFTSAAPIAKHSLVPLTNGLA